METRGRKKKEGRRSKDDGQRVLALQMGMLCLMRSGTFSILEKWAFES